MSKILIAGGAGFLGSHLCKKLLENGHDIICVDNLITGNKKNIEDLLQTPNFTFIEHDITKPIDSIKYKVESIKEIYNLASPASPNPKSDRSYLAYPVETLLTNGLGTYNLLQLAKQTGAKFLFTSTSEVYGDPAVSPQPESYWGNVNPNGIRSVYDEAKRYGEAMTFAFLRKYDLDVRIIRIFNTYGPYMQKDDGRVVSEFINQALRGDPFTVFGDGTQTRSFCYVDDMVDGIIKAMDTNGTKGEYINLGNPDERNILEIADIIKKLTKSVSPIKFEKLPADDPAHRKPDISKAKKLLHWEPKVGLEDGLRRTIEYFRVIS